MSNPDPQPDQKPGIWQSILQAAEGLPRELRFIVVFGVLLSILFIAGPNIPNNLVPLLYVLLIGGMGLYIYGEHQISQRQKEEHRHKEKLEEIVKPPPPVTVLPEPPPPADLQGNYLHDLFIRCEFIPMATVDLRAQRTRTAQIALQAIFTALDVADTRQQEMGHEAMGQEAAMRGEKERREPVLAAISRHRYLVLLGQPGSGKSTLVNFITYCLAGDGLGYDNINVPRLNEIGWTLPGLLPVRVILRQYAARGLPRQQTLWQFLTGELQTAGWGAYQAELKQHLERRGGILLLDGLDEVPQEDQRREQLRQAVLTFVHEFPQVRVLVTSRPYAYTADWVLPGFTRADLLDFSPEQINQYIDSWYAVAGELDPDLGAQRAATYAERLKREIEHKENLAELAPRPLLLALMVSLHRWHQGGGLPEKREELYDQSVDLLLELWQQPKQIDDEHGSREDASVLKQLGISRDSLRAALSRVAFEAHKDQPRLEGVADIPGGQIAAALHDAPGRDPGIKPDDIIDYIRRRAGLLVEQSGAGQGVYAFPHRTFQEYLAACHLFGLSTFPKELVRLARQDPQRWREAVLLAAGRAKTEALVWQLVQALCPHALPPDPAQVGEQDWWGAFLAGRVLWDAALFETDETYWQPVLDNVRAWLVGLIAQAALPPLDRAAAGEVADRLGYLPSDLNSWLPCPGCAADPSAGSGPDLLVMKYPVTNAQFALFMQAGGYKNKTYWAAGRFGEWDEPRYWNDARFGRGRRGFPVVGVSWYEACAYAAWLTALLARARLGETLPDVERALVADLLAAGATEVRLPEDAEWVKIAGGDKNDRYPWDPVGGPATKEVNAILERANTSELGWAQTTPVYQYPDGKSVPYGLMDMAGNVWEWVGDGRALRGGSWDDGQLGARVASRLDYYLPLNRSYHIRFSGGRPRPSGFWFLNYWFLAILISVGGAGGLPPCPNCRARCILPEEYMKTYRNLYPQICDWNNLYLAYHKARKGKRSRPPAAAFEFHQEEQLHDLCHELESKTYQPGPYHSFYIHEPKRRLISAAPFRDRVVHHALCNVIEPIFERTFIYDSYANRVGKGTHRAIDRCQEYARRFAYVLPCDLRQFFPSIDHAILRHTLAHKIADADTLWLVDRILNSGVGVLSDQYDMVWFPGDDLLAATRPRGLPIGNLTSQFWANCYLNPFDHFVKRELKCAGYVRYVDDMLLFADDKETLWQWHKSLTQKLAELRLTIHPTAQPQPVSEGIPFLGFVVYPDHRRLKRRKGIHYRRRLKKLLAEYQRGERSTEQVQASIRGWINHVRYADTWGLRRAILADVVL